MSLLNFFLKAKEKPAPLTPEQAKEQFITDICEMFALPWDGRKRLHAASAEIIDDVRDIAAYAEKLRQEDMPRDVFYLTDIYRAALVMDKLGYTKADIEEHQDFVSKRELMHTSRRELPQRNFS